MQKFASQAQRIMILTLITAWNHKAATLQLRPVMNMAQMNFFSPRTGHGGHQMAQSRLKIYDDAQYPCHRTSSKTTTSLRCFYVAPHMTLHVRSARGNSLVFLLPLKHSKHRLPPHPRSHVSVPGTEMHMEGCSRS